MVLPRKTGRGFERLVTSIKTHATALVFAWLGSAAIDVAVSIGLGSGITTPAPFAYYALYLFLGLAGSIVLGLILGVLGFSLELSIAIWVVLNGWSGEVSVATLVLGGCVWIALWSTRRFEMPAFLTGARIGAACGVALALWPQAVKQLPKSIRFDETLASLMPVLLVLTTFLIFCSVGGSGRNRLRRLAESAVALFIVFFAFNSGFQWTRMTPDRLPVYADRGKLSAAPHILLIVLDTLRADRMSIYGYERPTTPQLDAFIERHENTVVYPLAFANASWTVPSHASLFTGLLPTGHGAHKHSDLASDDEYPTFGLRPVPTLAGVLRAAGYRTGGIIGNPTVTNTRILGRGFDLWLYPGHTQPMRLLGEILRRTVMGNSLAWAFPPYAGADAVNTGVLTFLDVCGTDPCFVFANYMEPHPPHLPPPPHAGLFTTSSAEAPVADISRYHESDATLTYFADRYDESIHALDSQLGELLDALETRGFLDDSWLVITSDHGESFGEHGIIKHGTSLYNEQVWIPLIIKPPRGVQLAQTTEPVSLVDISATLAEVATGRSLGAGVSLLHPETPRKPVQMQYFGIFRPEPGVVTSFLRGLAASTRKLIDDGQTLEIYDLTIDLAEQNDLFATTSPIERERLLRLMTEMPKETADDSNVDARRQKNNNLTPDEKEVLRALGYIK